MKRTRILIFSIAYEPFIGGAELAVRKITDRLSYYDFDLITCRLESNLPLLEKIGNVNVYRVGFGGIFGRNLYPLFAYLKAKQLQKKDPYQIVWAIMAAYASAAALLFVRKFRVKFLLTLQEGDSIEHIHSRVWGYKRIWQKVFKKADYIQVISKFLANWARHEGAACPIEIVPNGVDLDKFKAQSSKLKVGGKRIIITVSRLVPKNGVDILIRAGAELKTLIPNSRFMIQILGGGQEEKKLKKLTQNLQVADVVEFKGEIEPDKVPGFLAQADIFVRPSRSEGLGNAFLEAMASGLPVVATRVGGISDFLVDSQTGLFCQIEDPRDLARKIQSLLSDDALRSRLAENGSQLVREKYSWTAVCEQMNNIFQKLLV